MNIGCVTRHTYPTDQEIRVTKFAATLHSHGHEFIVFCPRDEMQVSLDFFKYGRIIRLKSPTAGRIGKLLVAPLPINPVWAWWLCRQFRENSIDLVIVRDLRLALPVFFAARAYGIKAILDLGEHYPGMMEILGKQKLSHFITRNNYLITLLEILSVKVADMVWVVVEENKSRLEKYAKHIEVINNFPDIASSTTPQLPETCPYSETGKPITLISLGMIDNIRGLDLAIDAFALLIKEFNNLQLKIYGDGFFRETLEKQVAMLGLQGKVMFCGWLSENKKYDALTEGDIGLLLHKVCNLTHHTIPNKLFDYMYVGLPIVATRLRPVVRIVESIKCGIAVDDEPSSVARGIKNLILDVDKRKKFSENGYLMVRKNFTWDREEIKIIQNIRTLAKI